MQRIPVAGARAALADALNRVLYGHEQIVLQRRGKDIAALLPMEDYRLFQQLVEDEEDRIDVSEAQRRLSDPSERPIPYEQVRRDLGLPEATSRRKRAGKRAG